VRETWAARAVLTGDLLQAGRRQGPKYRLQLLLNDTERRTSLRQKTAEGEGRPPLRVPVRCGIYGAAEGTHDLFGDFIKKLA
jgi:hypothetical protein